MPSIYPLQTNFTTGEITPRLYGRIDLAKYRHAVAKALNFRVILHGGLSRRPGTRYVTTTKTPMAGAVRLLPFEFNDAQAYIIEAGNFYMRFCTLSGQLLDALNNPVEVVSPYAIADVANLHFTQSADTLYLFHKNYPPQKLTRTSATSFSLVAPTFLDGPYLPLNVTATTLMVSANTGAGLTMTASAALFQSGHVGSIWRIKGNAVWGWVKVTGFTSATVVTVAVQAAVNNGAAGALDFVTPGTSTTTSWREGMFSAVQGYPASGVFHQQRLWMGGVSNKPTAVIGSITSGFETMSDSKSDGTVLDTSSVVYDIATDKMNVIRWFKPGRNLLVGTAGSEHETLGGSSTTPAITPTNIFVRGQTTYGSNKVPPVRSGVAVLFPTKSGRKIRELAFDFNMDAYNAPDITILAEHLFPSSTSITSIAFQQEPDATLWVVLSNGALLSCAYDRSQDVVGWAQHATGSGDAFESIAVIPHPDGDRDQVWIATKRTIGGATQRFVEFLDDKGNPHTAYAALNTDAAITYSGPAATTFTGLSYLNGMTVDVVGNGAVYQQAVVSGGQVTISPAASEVEIGLHYDAEIDTLRPEVATQKGTSQGFLKKWAIVILRLHQTLGATIGMLRNPGDTIQILDSIPFRAVGPNATAPGATVPLFSGDVLKTQLGIDLAGQLIIKQTQPLPCTVVLLAGILEVAD